MALLKKTGTHTMRTRNDYELFKITFPAFNPDLMVSVTLHVGPGENLRPGQPLATVLHRPPLPSPDLPNTTPQVPLEQLLTTHVVGTVKRIGAGFQLREGRWVTKAGLGKGSLELAHIQQCEHIINNQSITDSNITGKTEPPSCDLCPRCGKEIWVFYSGIEEVTTEALMAANRHLSLEEIKPEELQWSIIINEQFTPNTMIARLNGEEIRYPALAKATYLLSQGEKPWGGVVMSIRRAICRHQKIYDNRCQYCMQKIEIAEMMKFTKYLFQLSPNNTWNSYAKGAALLHQQEQYISRILSKKKLILILDLDNTILHSNQMSELQLTDVLALKQYFLMPKVESVQGKMKQDFIVVKMRPFLKEFLFIISKLFQVYVYTKGTRIYADSICRWVRGQWGGEPPFSTINTWKQPPINFLGNTECFSPHRVVSRNEDSSMDTKSMQNILPTRTEYHLILDDRRDVWSNSPSWFFTRQYYYFYKKKREEQEQKMLDVGAFMQNENSILKNEVIESYILAKCFNLMKQNYPDKSPFVIEANTKEDSFLLFAANALRRIHNFFFEQLKRQKDQLQAQKVGVKMETEEKINKEVKSNNEHPISLSNLLHRYKQYLNRKKLRIFMVPGDEAISIERRAVKMGAIILKETQTVKPDYVIRGNQYIRYVKLKRQQNAKNEEQKLIKINLNIGQKQLTDDVKLKQKKQTIQEIIVMNGQSNQSQKKEVMEIGCFEGAVSKENVVVELIGQIKIGGQKQMINQSESMTANIKDSQNNSYASSQNSPSTSSVGSPASVSPKIDIQAEFKQFEVLCQSQIPVISQTWILASYQFSYKFKSQDFKLDDPFKEVVGHSDFDCVISKAAKKIQSDIEQHMKKQFSEENEAHIKKEGKHRHDKHPTQHKINTIEPKVQTSLKVENVQIFAEKSSEQSLKD